MTKATAPDPFAVFGLDDRLDLDPRAIERRWLQLSRENHPDHRRAEGTADCAAVLARMAEINDAWRVLKDRWTRAQALVELRAPGELDRQKQLDQAFLLEAMELAEEVAFAAPDDVPALRQRLEQRADATFAAIASAVAAADWAGAARRLHESRYVRKALADLDGRQEPGS